MTVHRALIKAEIVERFEGHVKGKRPNPSGYNSAHDGWEGDWLTRQMGLTVNGNNEPDFKGFEMKKDSAKTTFGDWSPNEAQYLGRPPRMSRDEFLILFGAPNPLKNNRYSWSGSVFPKIGQINHFGQSLFVDSNKNIIANYQYSKDQRHMKHQLIPIEFQSESLILAKWFSNFLKEKLERKFNQLGWFKLVTNDDGIYTSIQFGGPINYEAFISLVLSGDIFLDCGMHQGNRRPYMTWRASKQIWSHLSEDISE